VVEPDKTGWRRTLAGQSVTVHRHNGQAIPEILLATKNGLSIEERRGFSNAIVASDTSPLRSFNNLSRNSTMATTDEPDVGVGFPGEEAPI
jgi:hypothetical protein